MKLIGTLEAISSERDRSGNCYWGVRYVCHETGKIVNGIISGGSSNIYAVLLHWTVKKDYDRSVRYIEHTLSKREFKNLTSTWKYAGCSPEDIATFLKNELKS